MRIGLAMCLFGIGCGGGPALQNAPRPNPAIVAGAAAAIAGAATLADPAAAARAVEDNKPVPQARPANVRQTVPSAVFDRLDEQKVTKAPPEPPKPAIADPDDETIDARD